MKRAAVAVQVLQTAGGPCTGVGLLQQSSRGLQRSQQHAGRHSLAAAAAAAGGLWQAAEAAG